MCLEKKSLIPRIALKDIVVYKALNNFDGALSTKITKNTIKLGVTYKGIFRAGIYTYYKCNPRSLISSLFNRFITSGYIHSYPYKEIVEDIWGDTIVECIIPKGTLYFIGKNGDVASRRIKYIKVID